MERKEGEGRRMGKNVLRDSEVGQGSKQGGGPMAYRSILLSELCACR